MLLKGRRTRLARQGLAGLVLLIMSAAVAIAVALKVTPQQTVTVAGQVIEVGASAPSLSLSGPGEVDLFGQSLPTNILFTGPVRPRLELSQISINSELTTFVQGDRPAGAERILGGRLADGWKRYFTWETVITGAGALILVGAVAGWRRMTHRTTLKLLVAGLVVAEAINLGAIMITAYSAPDLLRRAHSLNDLVGTETRLPRIRPVGPSLPGVQVVVMGDSTAAGAGLAPRPGASGAALPSAGNRQPLLRPVRPPARLPWPGQAQRHEPADDNLPAGYPERGPGPGRGPVRVLLAGARVRRPPAVYAAAIRAGTGRGGAVSPHRGRPRRHSARRPRRPAVDAAPGLEPRR